VLGGMCKAEDERWLVRVDRHHQDELTGASSSAFVLTNDWEAFQDLTMCPCQNGIRYKQHTSQLDATVTDSHSRTSVRNLN
jgi:hypothetical protein